MERLYRRLARKVYRILRHPRRRKQSRFHAWVAHQVFDRRLWVPERHAFLNGLGAGVFISLLPFFLPQTVFAVLVCAYRRWNIPVAFACCWISNMATLVPLVYIQTNLGLWVCGWFRSGPTAWLGMGELRAAWHSDAAGGFAARMVERGKQMGDLLGPNLGPWLLGTVLSGILFGALAWGLGHALWAVFAHRVNVPHAVPHRHPPERK